MFFQPVCLRRDGRLSPRSFRACVISPFLLLLRGFMTTVKPHHHLSLLKASGGIQRAAQSYLLCIQGAPGQGRPLGTARPREAQDREPSRHGVFLAWESQPAPDSAPRLLEPERTPAARWRQTEVWTRRSWGCSHWEPGNLETPCLVRLQLWAPSQGMWPVYRSPASGRVFGADAVPGIASLPREEFGNLPSRKPLGAGLT